MANGISPKELSNFVKIIAAGIDASKKPRADLVASDIRCAIAAVNGDEGAVKRVRGIIANAVAEPRKASEEPSNEALALRFSGPLSEDAMKKVAAEIAKRRPSFKDKTLQFELVAKAV